MKIKHCQIGTTVYHRLNITYKKGQIIQTRTYDLDNRITAKRYLVRWEGFSTVVWCCAKDLLYPHSKSVLKRNKLTDKLTNKLTNYY